MKNQKKQNKKMAISDLAVLMDKGFKKVNKAIKKETEALALMTGKEFNRMGEEFNKLDKQMDKLETDIKEIKSDAREIKANLTKKVNIVDNKLLEYRIEKVEEKVGMTPKK